VSPLHEKVLRKIGADDALNPEEEAGRVRARLASAPHLRDAVPLADGRSLVDVEVPERFVGKTLAELDLRSRFGVLAIALKRPAEEPAETAADGEAKPEDGEETPPPLVVTEIPDPSERLRAGDVLSLVGSDEALDRVAKGR
jgi:trk system potassium uptake protein TrkA